tara:strand:- start:141 stop:380 length:240 start_codon:yes stop_codon:yes gene_type:complete
MTSVAVKFPFTTYLEDYHEGRYIAEILGKLVGQKISHEEIIRDFTDESAPMGYKFVFDVIRSEQEFSEFSRDKEAFIAP